MTVADPCATARFLGAFFDELAKWGVQNVVISPGSRSTPLSMTAYELSCRAPQRMSTYVDIDERGAAFLALGMAKASGRPAALVCSSGTAIANYYPAILEAESSRVPLIVLTADRPPQLQGLGAPQTCDQSHAYGTHVRAYRGMPLPADGEGSLRFARQAAREACIAALGSCNPAQNQETQNSLAVPSAAKASASHRLAGACFGGRCTLNFPFDEPLKPDVTLPDLFDAGIPCAEPAGVSAAPGAKPARKPSLPVGAAHVHGGMEGVAAAQLARELLANSVLLLAGEGSCATHEEAQRVLSFARTFAIPVLADPLSGLRSFDDPLVIGNYDSVFQPGGISPDEALNPQVIVRFGRYPVSKRATQWARAREDEGVLQVVADPLETRDTNAATTVFVRTKPADFAQSMLRALRMEDGPAAAGANDLSFANAWQRVEEAAQTYSRSEYRRRTWCRRLREVPTFARVLELAPRLVSVRGKLYERACRGHLLPEGRKAADCVGEPGLERHRRHGFNGHRRFALLRPHHADHGRFDHATRLECPGVAARAARAAAARRRRRRREPRAETGRPSVIAAKQTPASRVLPSCC